MTYLSLVPYLLLISLATDPPAAPGAIAPAFARTDQGLVLSWLEPSTTEDGAALWRMRWSLWTGEAWSEPETIRQAPAGTIFANWADVPGVWIEPGGGMLAHWLVKSAADTYAYDVVLSRRDPSGTWQDLGAAHDDGTPTEHGFVTATPQGDDLWLFWLDGRAMAGVAVEDDHGHGGGDMTLRTRRAADAAGSAVLLDRRVCECCNTDSATTRHGPIVVYRDRGEQETRDVSIVRHLGDRWSEPQPVHRDGWRIDGCPVNGPAVIANDLDVAVAWYTGAGERGSVRLAWSRDGGATFATPVVLDGDAPVGRIDVALDPADGSAIAGWIGVGSEGGEIRLCRVSPTGEVGTVHLVTEVSTRRASGFPRLAVFGQDLLVAWTEDAEERHLRVWRTPTADVR